MSAGDRRAELRRQIQILADVTRMRDQPVHGDHPPRTGRVAGIQQTPPPAVACPGARHARSAPSAAGTLMAKDPKMTRAGRAARSISAPDPDAERAIHRRSVPPDAAGPRPQHRSDDGQTIFTRSLASDDNALTWRFERSYGDSRTPDLLHAIKRQPVHPSTYVQVTRPRTSAGIQVGCRYFRGTPFARSPRGQLRSWHSSVSPTTRADDPNSSCSADSCPPFSALSQMPATPIPPT